MYTNQYRWLIVLTISRLLLTGVGEKVLAQSPCPGSENQPVFTDWIQAAPADAVVAQFPRLFSLDPATAQHIPCLPPLGDWSGNRVSSGYGLRIHPVRHSMQHHDGIDLAGPNQYVRAAAVGRVVSVGYSRSLGRFVRLDHGNSYQTVYGHLALTTVRPGDELAIGATLGVSGRTGRATGVHLHYAVTKAGRPVNPAPYLLLAIQLVEAYGQNPTAFIPMRSTVNPSTPWLK
jgi:murein DD-endopeptidase MepM/ murein hydrolase activator NlpD